MASAMLPATPPHVVLVAGGIFSRTLFRMLKTWIPRMNLEAYDVITADDVNAFVEEASAVPAFWLGDGSDRVPSRTKRRNLWCFERCLQDEGKITTSDVFNTGAWSYSMEAEAADVAENAHRLRRLQAT